MPVILKPFKKVKIYNPPQKEKSITKIKYGSGNEINVRIDNSKIRISEEVSSKGNFKFTNGI